MSINEIQSAIEATIKDAFDVSDVKVELSYPDIEHGQLATNVAFKLAGQLKQAPNQIAEQLALKIKHPAVASAKAAGGFINLNLTPAYWIEQAAAITPDYGSSQVGKGHKVQVEFISANPTGPMTLGNGRGGYNGDVLANVLTSAGYQVEREYYLNDAGNQIKLVRSSIYAVVLERLTHKPTDHIRGYRGEYIEEWADKVVVLIQQQHANPASLSDQQIEELTNRHIDELGVIGCIVDQIKATVARMGINFDNWFSELYNLHKTGKVKALVDGLVENGQAIEKDGAIWLKEAAEDSGDRVLQKSDGGYTYLAADLAYHMNKFERGFDTLINLWGSDHAAQVPSLQHGLKLLGATGELKIILFQLVRLIKDGKEFKVSKRAGTYVTIDELLDQVPSDVLRFFFLMRSYNAPMDLDLDLAKEQSQKNPMYYLMYSYARANSILEQASQRDLQPLKPEQMTDLTPSETALIRQLTRLPQLLQEIVGDYGVHRLSFYGVEVAQLFHELYESQKIIDLAPEQAAQRLALIQVYVTFMERYFQLLGITPIKKMG
ncbi:arginine--tRNA ligase [Patescibacteria group bacterium]|nr:MAG: arginine--tRNA ligase [Patescibacteria group bacterium]